MDGSDGRPGPKLTIITVCRNIAGEIAETCESVASQTFRDFEWIVVDGASDDGTLDALERYRPRIGTLISEPDRGPYHAMNKGVALARGEYLLFLNGGDYLVENTVLERVFASGKDADILYGDVAVLHADGFLEKYRSPSSEAITKEYFAYCGINHQAMLIKRDLFGRFGLYDEQYRIAADWERWVVFSKNGCSFDKFDFPLSVFRLNGMSSDKKNEQRMHEEAERIRAAHFTAEELRAGMEARKALKRFRRVYAWGALGRFSVFSVFQDPGGRAVKKYKFLNCTLVKIDERKHVHLRGIGKIW